MNLKRAILIVGAPILLFALLFVWEQYPYRGGKSRFTSYFGLLLPESIQQIPINLSTGSFWDDPRFRFHLNRSEFDNFKMSVSDAGFSSWKSQGGQYGSFNEDSTESDPLFFSVKDSGRCKLMLFYRPSTQILDAVTFYN